LFSFRFPYSTIGFRLVKKKKNFPWPPFGGWSTFLNVIASTTILRGSIGPSIIPILTENPTNKLGTIVENHEPFHFQTLSFFRFPYPTLCIGIVQKKK
jgi:hypothetical protein